MVCAIVTWVQFAVLTCVHCRMSDVQSDRRQKENFRPVACEEIRAVSVAALALRLL